MGFKEDLRQLAESKSDVREVLQRTMDEIRLSAARGEFIVTLTFNSKGELEYIAHELSKEGLDLNRLDRLGEHSLEISWAWGPLY